MNSLKWINYNNNVKLLKKLISYNKKNKFNIIEKGLYNHIRDIFSISIVFTKFFKKKNIKILDYGSNEIVYANLINKINLQELKLYVYDHYSKKKINKKKNLFIFNNDRYLKNKWDLINFVSSLQYLNDFSDLKKINFKHANCVLITHTPFSLGSSYRGTQLNNKKLTQNIHSLKSFISFMKSKRFNLKFKSKNPDKYISCKKKIASLSLNLIFLK